MAERTIYDERARVEEIADLRTRLAAAEARAATAERLVLHLLDHVETDEDFSADEVRADLRAFLDGTRTFDESKRLVARAQAAEARAARMEAALQPFASVGQWLFARDIPDETPLVAISGLNGSDGNLTRGHFKAAHVALASDPSALGQAIEGVLAAPGMQRGTVPEMDVLATAAWALDLVRDLIARVDVLRREWGQR